MILDLDAVTRNEIASMVYSRWCVAFDRLKEAKARTWESNKHVCPKADWPFFYKSAVDHADKEFKLAEKLKADICPFSPLIKGE